MNVQLVHNIQFFLDNNKEVKQLETISGIKLLDFDVVRNQDNIDPRRVVKLHVLLPDYSEFVNLKILYVLASHSDSKELKGLPEGLQTLVCCYNNITRLGELPRSLRVLDCSYNDIASLPRLPLGLQKLNCKGNHLEQLPELPDSLENLECAYNQLTSFPKLPKKLRSYCFGMCMQGPDSSQISRWKGHSHSECHKFVNTIKNQNSKI